MLEALRDAGLDVIAFDGPGQGGALEESGLPFTPEWQRPVAAVLDHFALDIPAGVLLGVAIGRVVVWARRRIDPAPVEIAVSIATPYAATLAAEALRVSVVASIVAAALVVSAVRIDRRTGAPISSSETRVSATAFWEEANLLVSGVLFFLAGRALPEALGALEQWSLWQLGAGAAALLVVVLAVQFVFGLAATFLPPLAPALETERGSERDNGLAGGQPVAGNRAAAAAVMAWASTRSVIGLLIALSIPAALPDGRPFPERDLILVVGALLIIGSVLLQGLSLRVVVRRAALCDESEERREEDEARRAIVGAIKAPKDEHANGFDAARQALVALRERDRIGDEVLVRMLRETDLRARAAEGSALPGAGPPSP
jgi:CPA1 family monovalent cation:H+ antiporter